jgi:sec-independent protein translocase protein TatC
VRRSTKPRAQKAESGRMAIAAHLAELRRRLFRSAAALLAGVMAGWFLATPVLDALRAPIEQVAATQHRLAELNYDTITGAFDLRMQVAMTVGVIVSSPVWLYQLWAFLVPALNRRERLYGFGFFFTAVPLFLAGCLAGWFVLPHMVGVLTGFAPQQDAAIVQAKTYFDFVLKLIVAIGVAFVLPIVVVLLNFVGVLRASTIVRSWRVAVIAIALFTAIATPAADVLSMVGLAVPMVALFFAAAGVAALHDRRADRKAAAILASTVPELG